jgi:hypothetical protein
MTELCRHLTMILSSLVGTRHGISMVFRLAGTRHVMINMVNLVIVL